MIKFKSYIYVLILVFVTFAGMSVIPALVKKATYSPASYPYVYYSSILKELCFVDFTNKHTPLTDQSGNVYTTSQYDSLMPLLNYRQLLSDGRQPDSLNGIEITPQLVRAKSVSFRYTPSKVNAPDNGLHILLESMPKRLGLELPNDVFMLHNSIEFVDMESNRTDVEKSNLFRQALDKAGFVFPAQWSVGNPTTRKAYDEGYFTLDAEGKLFHIKMVNDRPYIRNTLAHETIDIASFSMYEVADRRFYGLIFGRDGGVFILNGAEGKYVPQRLDIDPLDLDNDIMLIIGNVLYWTVSVTREHGRDYYALETESLERVDEYSIEKEPGKWEKLSKFLFPLSLTFERSNTKFIGPKLYVGGWEAFAVSLALAVLIAVFVPDSNKRRIFKLIYITATGIVGAIALLILPGFRCNNTKR